MRRGTNCPFQVAALGDKKLIAHSIAWDANPFYTGVKCFVRMFRTGVEPISHARLLKPVLVLEATEHALKSGKAEEVCS